MLCMRKRYHCKLFGSVAVIATSKEVRAARYAADLCESSFLCCNSQKPVWEELSLQSALI